jgi:hypothetical protein
MEEIYQGAGVDTRPEEEKAQDWKTDQFSSGGEVNWQPKTKYKFYSKRNQFSSLSCMAQSGVKVAGVDNFLETGEFIDFSAMEVYRSRFNFPSGGMILYDLLKLLTTKGKIFRESDLISQNLDELQMNSNLIVTTDKMLKDATAFQEKAYVQFPIELSNTGVVTKEIDPEEVAQILEQGKAVEAMLFFEGKEYWKTRPEITNHELKAYDGTTSRHGIAIVDYLLIDGEKCFIIEDSAGNTSSLKDEKGNNTGQRILTAEFLKKRCFGAGYLIDQKNVVEDAIKLLVTLRQGSTGSQVKILQEILNTKDNAGLVTDGIFGKKTDQAVRLFQAQNHLTVDGIVGKNSRAKLNS